MYLISEYLFTYVFIYLRKYLLTYIFIYIHIYVHIYLHTYLYIFCRLIECAMQFFEYFLLLCWKWNKIVRKKIITNHVFRYTVTKSINDLNHKCVMYIKLVITTFSVSTITIIKFVFTVTIMAKFLLICSTACAMN